MLLCMAFWGGDEKPAPVPAAPQEKRINVVVAKGKIESGQPLEKANVALEERPLSTLPADAIQSLDALKNKVAAGPIPAGYPLALALLADPVVVVPVKEENKTQGEPADPIDLLFKEIASETVALPLTFSSKPPQRGSRIAVILSSLRGESIVVVEECWVAELSNERQAVVRLDPIKALFLKSAAGLGEFGFIELPVDGPSPYLGKAVNNIEDLKLRLAGKPANPQTKAEPKEKRMKGYAWISGEGRRYGISSDDEIVVMGPGEAKSALGQTP